MLTVQATFSELARSFDFAGRTSPAIYFRYLAVATCAFGLTLYIVYQVFGAERFALNAFLTILVFYVPVTSAGVRRLHDAGMPGNIMLFPLKPLVAILIIFAFNGAFIWFGLVSLLFAIPILFVFTPVVVAISLFAYTVCALLSLFFFCQVSKLLLLPSQSGPNRFGPNPNEVTS